MAELLKKSGLQYFKKEIDKMKVELLFITQDAEKLIEVAGRTSYLSFDKQGKDTEKAFIRMLIKNGHFLY